MHVCAFRCEFIDLVDFLALLLYPLVTVAELLIIPSVLLLTLAL